LPRLSATVIRSVLNETAATSSQTFSATTALSIITDVIFNSGLEGGAGIEAAGNRFTFTAVTAVPEPSTYALLLASLLAISFMRRERARPG
jgi:hypothetical protein